MYIWIQAVYVGSYGIFWSYIATMLIYYGFSTTWAGTITACSTLLYIFVGPIISRLVDKSIRITCRQIIVSQCAISFLAAILLVVLPIKNLWGIGLTFLAIGVTSSVVTPFLSTMAMEYSQHGIPINYSVGRGVGSLAYAGTVLCGGIVLENAGSIFLLALYALCQLFLIILLQLLRSTDTYLAVEKRPQPVPKGKMDLHFALVLVAAGMLIASHQPIYTYMVQIVSGLGSAESSAGLSLAISSIVEFPVGLIFYRLLKFVPEEKILKFSALFFIIKPIALLFASSLSGIYLAQTLQIFQHALFLPGIVYYTAKITSPNFQAQGQALMYAAEYGIGAAAGNWVAGFFLENLGVSAMLACCIAFAVLGSILLYTAINAFAAEQATHKEDSI